MIEMPCPSCGRALRIDDAYAGKKGSCTHCNHKFVVPEKGPVQTTPLESLAGSAPPSLHRSLPERVVPSDAPRREEKIESAEADTPLINSNTFLVEWILATVVGVVLIGFLWWFEIWFTGEAYGIFDELRFLLLGATVGLMQWLVLRRHTNSGPAWVFATGVAWIVGVLLAVFATLPAMFLFGITGPQPSAGTLIFAVIAGLLIGLPVGFAQWLTLRRRFERMAHWITINAAIWPLLVIIGGGVGYMVAVENRAAPGVLFVFTMDTVLMAALTGFAMVALLARQEKLDVTPFSRGPVAAISVLVLAAFTGGTLWVGGFFFMDEREKEIRAAVRQLETRTDDTFVTQELVDEVNGFMKAHKEDDLSSIIRRIDYFVQGNEPAENFALWWDGTLEYNEPMDTLREEFPRPAQ